MWSEIPISLKELVSGYFFLTQLTLPGYSTINLGRDESQNI